MIRSAFIFFILLFAIGATAQQPERPISVPKGVLGDSIIVGDTTTMPVDTVATPVQQSDIETTINYSASDSIKFGVNDKIVYLYGDAKVDYGAIKVEAEQIEIDWATSTVTARGVTDSLGNKIGYPVFHNGAEVYVTKGMKYNFETGRASIKEVVTQQGEGYIHGKEVFKNAENELFSIDNTYTTCNLEHPHYRIRSKRTKAIPNDKIVSGPFRLEINDVPTPLGFAFGLFPMQNESSSGVIMPSYGEERLRGFFLRQGGYFFDINDYVKVRLTGDIYSKGGHGLNLGTNYKKRYKYTGNFNFSYTKIKLSQNIEDESARNDFQLRWSHTPQSKGNSRFSASVNAATSSYNENNNLNVQQNINRNISSNISYSKTFQGTPFSLGLSARHNQKVGTNTDQQPNEVSLLLPDLTFNMENIYPFKKKGASSKTWYEKMALRWSMNGTNQVTNRLSIPNKAGTDSIASFDFNNLSTFLENSRKGVRHNIPISTSLKFLKYFTLTPSFNYNERWYFEKLNWRFDAATNKAVADTISGFNRTYDYSTSASIATRVYGTVFFKKGNVKAIRHVINPSLSFSYTPNFGAEKFNFYQEIKRDTTSDNTIFKSRYEGFVYGSPGMGESGSIGLSVTNNLEMKVKSKVDSIEQDRKISLLNNFGFSTSYNLVADSFNLAPISIRANTNLFENKIQVSFTGTLEPYQYVIESVNEDGSVRTQRKIDRFHWKDHFGVGDLSRASIAISTNLNPKARNTEQNRQDKINNSNLTDDQKQYLLDNPADYVDFDIPWSLRINYNISYSKTGFQPSNTTQGLSFSGDLSLSEKWKISYRSGYDFERKDFTQTNIGIHRELHCWQMNLNWTPFGRFQSYNFTIGVKSSLLQDLKIDKRRSFQDNIF